MIDVLTATRLNLVPACIDKGVERFDSVLTWPSVTRCLLVTCRKPGTGPSIILGALARATALTILRVVDNHAASFKQFFCLLLSDRFASTAQIVSKKLFSLFCLVRIGSEVALLDAKEQGVVHDVEVTEKQRVNF